MMAEGRKGARNARRATEARRPKAETSSPQRENKVVFLPTISLMYDIFGQEQQPQAIF